MTVTSVNSGEVVKLSTCGHRLVTASKTATPNVVAVNPRKLQYATMRGPPGTTGDAFICILQFYLLAFLTEILPLYQPPNVC